MRQGLLCVLLIMLSLGHLAHAEDAPAPDTSVPLSLSAGARITDLQQRLADSERLRGELTQALKNADTPAKAASSHNCARKTSNSSSSSKKTVPARVLIC